MGERQNVIDRALQSISRLCPPAPIMNSVLAEMSSGEISFARLARLIQKDSVLTAAFLQRANSAIFQRETTVRSVLQALTLLGTGDLERFALSLSSSLSVPRTPLAPSFSRTRYARHASATALLTVLIERRLGNPHGSHAHLAALLHDISRLLVATGLPEEFSLITEHGSWDEDREMEVLGMSHAELSAIVLQSWKMSPEVIRAVEDHHSEQAPDSRPSLAAILHAADAYTAVLLSTAVPDIGDFDQSALCGLGIDAAIPALVVELQTQSHLAPQ
jgi:putative nucleotidyltransferase with HDIG domain